jgi:hypothetical protein
MTTPYPSELWSTYCAWSNNFLLSRSNTQRSWRTLSRMMPINKQFGRSKQNFLALLCKFLNDSSPGHDKFLSLLAQWAILEASQDHNDVHIYTGPGIWYGMLDRIKIVINIDSRKVEDQYELQNWVEAYNFIPWLLVQRNASKQNINSTTVVRW